MLVRVLQLLAAATALLHATDAATATATQPIVKLSTGAKVSGFVETNVQGKQVNAYVGIPYTDAPIGDKRWKQSAVKTLTKDLNATAYGNVCPGNPTLDPATALFPNDEDCLYLNVFTPAGVTSKDKLPVMVWVHGGSFVSGAGNLYDGANLIGASGQKVIVVNFNYRLGALGFLSNEAILKEGKGANFGLRDQETAFLWVKKYIASFGGNPNDITAFGNSAGAISLAHHLTACDGTQQLFHKAILQSGGYTQTQFTATKAVQAQQSAALLAAVGCTNAPGGELACLRKAPASAIFAATQQGFVNYPTVDNVYMKRMPFLSLLQGKVSPIPTVIGTNTDDGWYFTLTAPEAAQFDAFIDFTYPLLTTAERSRLVELYPATSFASPQFRVSEIFSDAAFVCAGEIYSELFSRTVADTYRYRFNYPSNDFGFPLVLHIKDLDYVFDRTYNLPNATEATTLVGNMQKFWTNFAVTGSPNGKKATTTPAWPRYNVRTKQAIVLEPTLRAEADAAYMPRRSERCAFWFQVEARLATAFEK